MKEFLKPTLAKLILIVLIPFYFGVIGDFALGADGVSTIIVSQVRVVFLPYVVLIFSAMVLWISSGGVLADYSFLSTGQKILYLFTEAILPLLINYLLACLIVYIYRIFKGRTRKEAEPEQQL